MKLDKIKFANVIAHISECIRNQTIDKHDIQILDELIDIDGVPDVQRGMSEVDELLRQMKNANGEGFIPAIKAYRVVTGAGLKEAKEAVEKYR